MNKTAQKKVKSTPLLSPDVPLDSPKKNKKTEEKGRWHFLETYHSRPVIDKCLKDHSAYIVHWAYILHDRDIFLEGEKEGQLKEPHYHVLLYLSNTRTVKTVQNWFDTYSTQESANTRNPELCKDAGLSFAYLMHKRNPEKAQYREDLISTDDRSFWCSVMNVSIRKADYPKEADGGVVAMFDDLIAGFTAYQMVHKWGKAYVTNSVALRHLYLEFTEQETCTNHIEESKKTLNALETQISALHDRLNDLKGKYVEAVHSKFRALSKENEELRKENSKK